MKHQKNSPIKRKLESKDFIPLEDSLSNIQDLAFQIIQEVREVRQERKTWVSVLYHEGLSQEEIAKVLNTSQSSVSRILMEESEGE